MAYMVEGKFSVCWVPDGAGSAIMGQQQANFPGYGASAGPGSVPAVQELSIIVGESVPGGDSPSEANFQTAFNTLASDVYSQFTTPGEVPGFSGSGTAYATVQTWATGEPANV